MSDTIALVPTYGDDVGKTLIYPDNADTDLAVVRGELVLPGDWDPEADVDTIPTVEMTPTVGDSAGDVLLYPATEDTQLAYIRGELDTVEGGVYPGDTTGGDDTPTVFGADGPACDTI